MASFTHPFRFLDFEQWLRSKVDGQAVIDGPLGSFHVRSIYGVDFTLNRANLWRTLDYMLVKGHKVVDGDFNFIEDQLASNTRALLLHGPELDEWRSLKDRVGLLNAFSILNGSKGSRFTWRRVINNRLVQSRFDKFFISANRWWVSLFCKLIHIADQILSNHNPVKLLFQIEAPMCTPFRTRKASYFKANSKIIDPVAHMDSFESA